jgi:glycosyltransferase involved in cell wall biosynthesis
MHIVFFHRKLRPGWQSIEQSFAPLIEELRKEHQVDVYHLPYSEGYPLQLLKNIIYVRKHACSDGINHISGDVHYCILGLLGKKSVVTIHDDYSVVRAQHGWLDKLYRWMFWIYLPIKYCSAPVCTNPLNVERIKKLYNSPKLMSICHLYPSEDFHISQRSFNKECPRILQVGTDTNKNLETTLKVLKGMKCKLVVLKPMTGDQKKMAERYGIDYTNRYDIPFSEVVKEYEEADIVVFPSTYEGTGIPIMEGQASGKIVITTNAMPMNWVAGDGAVLLNDPLDVDEYHEKLERVINDDEYRNNIIEKGIKNAKRFTREEGIRQYEGLYRKLLLTK